MKKTLFLGAAMLALTSVSACGLTGDLKRPGPLMGDPNSEMPPAELPDASDNSLPQLPNRVEDGAAPDAEDELLGGPGGSL